MPQHTRTGHEPAPDETTRLAGGRTSTTAPPCNSTTPVMSPAPLRPPVPANPGSPTTVSPESTEDGNGNCGGRPGAVQEADPQSRVRAVESE